MGSADKLQAVLESLDLARYADVFRREEIDDGNLHQLTEDRLQRIGVPLGPALKIVSALAGLGVASNDAVNVVGSRELLEAPRETAGEHRQVTVVYCDLVHSTELTHQLGNERYAAFHARYIDICERIVARYGQAISSQKGDGIAVFFGLRTANEDDADRALRAAIEMSEAISKLPTTPGSTARCRIGIGTGSVAVVSSDAFGGVMSLANRLQDLGGPGDIIVADLTRRICGEAFAFADLGYRQLKGFAPQRAWRLAGSIAGISRFEATRGRGLSPLTGRDHELAEIGLHWQRARGGQGQVVLVEGEAGFGKSRLMREFVAHAVADEDVVVQQYQCTLRRRDVAYYPIIEQLEQSAGILPHQSPREKLERLQNFLVDRVDTRASSLGVLAALLGIEETEVDARPSPADLPDQIIEMFNRQLADMCRDDGVLLVFEDVHWIDSATAELLIRAAAFIQAEALPVLMLLTHRPIKQDDAGAPTALVRELTGSSAEIKLAPLKRHESVAIIEHVANGRLLAPDVLQSIARRADDVPLFIEEVTKYVLAFGALHELETHQPVLLDRIQPYLTGRLDALGRPAREVAQVGAVIGRQFSARLVSYGLERDVGSLEPELDRLVRSELVDKEGDDEGAVYAFRHALVQDAAYGSLFECQKRSFHYRIGEALERLSPEIADSQPDVLAWHFTEGGEPLKAIDYWRRAGEAAISRSAMAEARRQFERGNEIVANLSAMRASLSPQDRARLADQELDLLTGLDIAVYALEGSGDKRLVSIYERVLKLAQKRGRLDREFDAHLGLSNYYYVGGNLTEGKHHIRPCLDIAERSGDEDQLVSAHRIAGELSFYLGDMDRAIDDLRQATTHYRAERHGQLLRKLGDDPGVLARMYLAVSLWFKGEREEGFQQCEEGLLAAERLRHEYTLGQATFDAAWLHAIARNHQSAKKLAARSTGLCSNGRDAFRLYLGCSRVISGWIMTCEGELQEGIAVMQRAMPIIEDTDAEVCLSCFLPWLAEGLGRAGMIEEGLRVIEKAHEIASEHFYDAERLRIEGELRGRIDAEGAERCLLKAVEASRRSGMKSLELRSALALLDLKSGQGEAPDAQALLGHLRPWLEREHDGEDMHRARGLLAGP